MQPEYIDKEKLTELERKKKRGKWKDIMTAIGYGMQGKNVSQADLPTNIYEAREQKMLDDYKNVVNKNRAVRDAWNLAQYNSRMKWLEMAYAKAKTPEQ
jgi:hypothetical protein